ncbi:MULTISPECIES: cell division protein ZapA [unclassified Paraflavitalea]|jgi:hypothetical protein|uniref:cell division protein ZapA n=1 Tax=unclassified Paraflavitalea TaxID=2798305 RepID=UPI003D3562DF
MEELITINILIADRTYRVKVAIKDEEVVRKTLKMINDKILEFKTQFAGKDMQDYLAMVILWYATQNQASPDGGVSDTILDTLGKMELQLDKALENN